jgi:ubiquinone/menaquinone biosynthesis C-methylase UbiE
MSSPGEAPSASGATNLPPAAVGFLRWFFRHLYTTFAWAYDLVAWLSSFGQWSAWRRTALGFVPPGATFLELGYGTGHLLVEAQRRSLRPVGVDASRQMAGIAARRLKRAGLEPTAVRGLAAALPFASRSLPLAISTFPSEYIFDPTALAEIRRVLARPGALVVALSAPIQPRFVWEQWTRWLYRRTGQAPAAEARLLDPFRRAGFRSRFEKVEVPGASVHYIIAEVP